MFGGSHMIRKLLFVLCFVSLTAVVGSAQARRTVANSDLEPYREKRVTAERQLREDYAKLGFPSPDELLRRDIQSQQQLVELSARLKQERLERERLELERERLMQPIVIPSMPTYGETPQPGELFWPTVWGFDGRHGRRRGQQQDGYFAGGQFWPTGPRTPLRPAFHPTTTPGPPHH